MKANFNIYNENGLTIHTRKVNIEENRMRDKKITSKPARLNNKTKVAAIICPSCSDQIFSRARHDFHYCSCGEVAIDGGDSYTKVVFKKVFPERITLTINASKQELYNDWNNNKNKFGIIKGKNNKN